MALVAACEAQEAAPGWDACFNSDGKAAPATKVEACTLAINSGKVTGKDLPYVLNNRGYAYSQMGNLAAAISDYNQTIELNPQYVLAYINRGSAYANLDDPRALADYDEAGVLDPQSPAPFNGRGFYFLRQRDYDKAIVELDKAIAIDPKHLLAHVNRGNVYSARGDVAAAFKDYDSALSIDPAYPNVYLARANAYWTQDKNLDAIAELKRGIAAARPDARLRLNLAQYLSDLSRADEALKYLSDALTIDPSNEQVFGMRSSIHMRAGDFQRAEEALTRGIELNPSSWRLIGQRGAFYSSRGDYARAVVDADRAALIDPNNFRIHDLRCSVRARGSVGLDGAAEACDRAVASSPPDLRPFPLMNRGVLAFKQGRFQDAWTDFDTAFREQPRFVDAQFARGVAALRLGRAEADADIATAKQTNADVAGRLASIGIAP